MSVSVRSLKNADTMIYVVDVGIQVLVEQQCCVAVNLVRFREVTLHLYAVSGYADLGSKDGKNRCQA